MFSIMCLLKNVFPQNYCNFCKAFQLYFDIIVFAFVVFLAHVVSFYKVNAPPCAARAL